MSLLQVEFQSRIPLQQHVLFVFLIVGIGFYLNLAGTCLQFFAESGIQQVGGEVDGEHGHRLITSAGGYRCMTGHVLSVRMDSIHIGPHVCHGEVSLDSR